MVYMCIPLGEITWSDFLFFFLFVGLVTTTSSDSDEELESDELVSI